MFVAPWEADAGPMEIVAAARAADEAGFFAISACEHIAVPPHRAVTMGTQWADPIAVLSLCAGWTSRVKLMTYVYLLAARHPMMAAKSLATLDYLSGGRLVAGVGAGHVEEEFDVVGADYASRGRRLTESIGELKAWFTEEHPTFEGRPSLGLRPRPVASPRPPIMVGGSSTAAVRRAARHADGWLPQGPVTPELVGLIRSEREAAGLADTPFTIGAIAGPVYIGTPPDGVGPCAASGSAEQVAEALRAMVPAESSLVHVLFRHRSSEELCDQVRAFGAEVAPLVR